MPYEVTFIIGLVIYLFGICTGIYVYKFLDIKAKILLLLLVVTIIVEITATYCAYVYKNNFYVYGLFNPIQLFMICWYYNEAVYSIGKRKVGLAIGSFAFIVAIVNYFFIQSPSIMNSNFLLLESLIVISLSLYAFYDMLVTDEDKNLLAEPHFWVSSLFMFFWTSTFLSWGVYDYLRLNVKGGTAFIHDLLLVVNVITYLGFGTVFLLYKKMQTAHGR